MNKTILPHALAFFALVLPAYGVAQAFVEKDFDMLIASPGIIISKDFDGNGYPDLLVQDSTLRVFFNGKDGFVSKSLPIGQYRKFNSLTVGDINKDGFQDVFITGEVPSGCCSRMPENSIILNTDGKFGGAALTKSTIPAWKDSQATLADMDKDKDPDLLISGEGIGTPRIYENVSGVFIYKSSAIVPASEFVRGVASWEDMDGDGDLDIAIAGTKYPWTSAMELWRNDGSFKFTSVLLRTSVCGTACRSVTWGDVDSDLKPDVLVGSYIYLNRPNENYPVRQTNIERYEEGFSTLLDMDLDGDLDIFAAGASESGGIPESDLYRNSNGTFTKANFTFQEAANSYGTTLDYDQDGDLDIAYVRSGYARILIYENLAIQPAKKTPSLSSIKLTSKGNFSFVVGNIAEDGTSSCALAPQVAKNSLSKFSTIKSLTVEGDSKTFTSGGVIFDSRYLKSFVLRICKTCPGFANVCSAQKKVTLRGFTGGRTVPQLIAKLKRNLKVKRTT